MSKKKPIQIKLWQNGQKKKNNVDTRHDSLIAFNRAIRNAERSGKEIFWPKNPQSTGTKFVIAKTIKWSIYVIVPVLLAIILVIYF